MSPWTAAELQRRHRCDRASPLATGYPVEWEADVVLRDGTVAHVRPITPGRRRRHPALPRRAVRRVDLPALLRAAAPAERPRRPPVHARRLRRPGRPRRDRARARSSASAATTASTRAAPRSPSTSRDHYQGKGIGSVLLEHLAAIAQEFGIDRFTAEVLPQNRKMLSVFTEAGYEVTPPHRGRRRRGVASTSRRPSSRKAVRLSREHRAEAREHAHDPASPSTSRSSAPAGARTPSAASSLANILAAGFTGAVYAVNREAVRDPGPARPTPSVADVPGPVDLAVVAVPGGRGARRRRRLRRGRGQGAARGLGRLRRGRRGGRPAAGRAAAAGPAAPACASSGPTPSG